MSHHVVTEHPIADICFVRSHLYTLLILGSESFGGVVHFQDQSAISAYSIRSRCRVSDRCSDTINIRTDFLTNQAVCHTHSRTIVSPSPAVIDVANISATHCILCLLCIQKLVFRKYLRSSKSIKLRMAFCRFHWTYFN